MRAPEDVAPRATRSRGRGRWWILIAAVILIILVASLRSLATIYTDSLWFSSVKLHSVWTTLLTVKVGLFASFGAIFFVALWANLLICDRMGASSVSLDPEDELVRRYQHVVRPYAGRLYAALAFVFALVAASGTIGEWQNWILFTHAQPFPNTDPQFHKNVGFYVFKLPFYSFLVNWVLVSLIVILVVTVIFHYLNGGIRLQRPGPRVRPSVKVHVSVLLALIALAKAVGYILARWDLLTSNNGFVEGAGYTDVHIRLPALLLLCIISLLAAVILLVNIWRQGWTLPIIAVGIWAFVALAIGVIYPAIFQTLRVNPAQSALEGPYIGRNIMATRDAYNIENVKTSYFAGSTAPFSPSQVQNNRATLNNIRLWDPDPTISLTTFQKLQEIRGYYTFQSVAVDRYHVNGQLTPVIVGVRQVTTTQLQSPSWVNQHLYYTHGEALALAEANQTTANGNPPFSIKNVPVESSNGLPAITQPDVYFGLNDPGYVVADTKQPELDYQLPTGINKTTHYGGPGGVPIGGFFTRAAFAVRLGDLNLLISNLITSHSRIMFVRDVQEMAQKAAPFLSFDADPYSAVVNGHVVWILDAYTTTDRYPYSQNADTQLTPPGSGLPGSYNYVRNSVKVVVDAYSGQMTFYAMTQKDPILRAYESAFPHMFTPRSQMPPQLVEHLRYPEDLFSIQAAVYGRYHIVSPSNFYSSAYAWNLSPTAGVGSPSNALAVTITTNAQGQTVTGPLVRMSPVYQVLQEPGNPGQSFTISDAYVAASNASSGSNAQNLLSAFLMGNSDPAHYGELHAFEVPSGATPVNGPVAADSEIQQNPSVSRQISLLDTHGSQVVLGNILPIPVDKSIVYIRPLYIESTGNPLPQLKYVIAVYGQNVDMESSLSVALSHVLGTSVGSGSGATAVNPGGRVSTGSASQAQQDLTSAQNDYNAAVAALKNGDLATYANDIAAMESQIQAAQSLLGTSGTSSSTTTTTTTAPAAKPTTTTAPKAASLSPSSSTTTTSGHSGTTAPKNEA